MKYFISGLLLSLFFLWPATALPEYRVFLLKISKPALEPGQPEESRFIESTLDPEQYRLYYIVYPNEKLSYVDTWRCYGRTEHKALCPNPRAPAAVDPNAPPSADPKTGQDQISPANPPPQ